MKRHALNSLVDQYIKISAPPGWKANKSDRTSWADLVVGVAYHEAAHAVVGTHLRFGPPVLVTIERGSEYASNEGWGFVRWPHACPPHLLFQGVPKAQRGALRPWAEAHAKLALAGLAQDVLLGSRDYQSIEELLEAEHEEFEDDQCDTSDTLKVLTPFERSPVRRWAWMVSLAHDTEALVRTRPILTAIGRLAEALLNKPTLDGDELHRHLQSVETRPTQTRKRASRK